MVALHSPLCYPSSLSHPFKFLLTLLCSFENDDEEDAQDRESAVLAPAEPSEVAPEEFVPIQPKPVRGIGMGNIARDMVLK